ncbi:hypothetical protein I302_103287 [Kwoniella bestiolae CBS 10118]|uniref:WSC domain-containing protein n=1 Tax=Kwoniella bestiolae CBS 10118 TaxID=1296100 RepID=A0A1B9G830_9TREE|nr:hypothetical protein I302_01986 [Kwoniella bestiolae CBS 10118]OCF27151.1 hypothetical protein I302_01986 [Kwoniella bestiolae CBS 10118]
MFTQLFSLLPLLAALPAANAYFILAHPVLETTRLDPIVNPGDYGSHVHSIVGGNNFDKSMTYESTQQSTCTTASVSVDKSNYWIPQLYYYNPSGKNYQAIPVSYVNTYYLPRYSPGEKTVRAFPDGLRMISGDPNRKTFDGDAASKAITYVCLDYYNNHSGDPAWAERNSFFEHNCPQGMRAQVFFPSCWDGVNLDSDDHRSHMAWPSGGVDGGSCPSTHPVRLVSLFYEFIYNVQNFPYNNGSDPTYVWANGDTTGYGLHADFLNGWPSYNNGTNVLQQALDGCNDNNGVGGELKNCPPFVPYLDSASASSCTPLNDQVNEDVGFGHYISKLPGDNTMDGLTSSGNYSDDGIGFTDFKSVIPAGYTDVGCIAEGKTGRALAAASFSSDNMTRSACVSWCQDRGYPLAGIEYGRECYCDFAMRNGATNTTLLAASQCGKACANNTNENCGGSSTLELFNNPSLYPVAKYPTGWSSNGCYTEGSGSRALTGYSFATSSMTQELCMTTCQSKGFAIAGIEYSSECYCGNSFSTGSVPATDNCNMVCSGNSLQTCGGPSRLTTFKYSNATVATSASASASASSAKASSSASASASASSAKASSSSSSAVVSSSTSKAVSSTFSSSSVSKGSSSSARASSSASSSTSSIAKITSSSSSSVVKSTSSAAKSSSSSSSIKPSSSSSAAKPSSSSSSATKPTSTSSSKPSSSSSTSKPSSSSAKPTSSSSSSVKPSSSSSSIKSSSSSSPSTAPTPVAKFASPQKASSSVPSSSTSSAAASSSASASSSAAKSSTSSVVVASSTSSAAASSSPSSSAAKSSTSSAAASSSSSAAASSSSSAAKSSTSSAAPSSSSSSAAASSSSSAAKSSTSSLVPSSTSSSASAPSSTASEGAYMAYVGCFKDTSGGRHLNGTSSAGSNMNNEVCTSYCQSKGYAYAGTEYAQECYCGNYLNLALASAESKCSTPCRAVNPTTGAKEICGGGMLLSVYTTGLQANAKPYGTKPANPTKRSGSAKFRL